MNVKRDDEVQGPSARRQNNKKISTILKRINLNKKQ